MANNQLGELRRSSVITTFGPGAVVDFRADGASVSAVVAGLEEWDNSFHPKGLANPQVIREPRLEKKLRVKGFRLPPVVDEDWRDEQGKPDSRSLVAVRFPQWLQCPQCHRLAPADKWPEDPGRAYRYCARCTVIAPSRKKVFAIPARFVVACTKGHLDDFPWHSWIKHKKDCEGKYNSDLYLKPERAGLAGLILSCSKCNARRSMDGIFSKSIAENYPNCRGRRPWLAVSEESCDCQPRAMQRGASNLYFPVIDSALSIPPWSDVIQEALGIFWWQIVNLQNPDDTAKYIDFHQASLNPILEELQMTSDELADQINQRLMLFDEDAILNIREEEYRQIFYGANGTPKNDREFEVRSESIPDWLSQFFSKIVRVVRLREVRAIKGFTRINPPGDEDSPEIASLSAGNLDWLPAIEVRGEGIFLALNQETLKVWEKQECVVTRANELQKRFLIEWKQYYGDSEPTLQITPRFLLIHTFAHALIRQLTLECGYSTAALRERLYVGNSDDGMSGLLIYTSSSDTDGTLGGLQRQGESKRIEQTIKSAIGSMEWCSADPLCIQSRAAGPSSMSLASCHSCVFASETSCEQYNRFLDRATLVGLPDTPQVGYFHSILQGLSHG